MKREKGIMRYEPPELPLAIADQIPDENPLRGLNWDEVARQFIKDFPHGTLLNAEQFDKWAWKHGYVPEPKGLGKKTDGWLAHLQRRHILRYNMNKAGTHSRMEEFAFTLDKIDGALYEVRTPQLAIHRHDVLKRVTCLLKVKQKRLKYLFQSADWAHIPPFDRALAEEIYDELQHFRNTVEMNVVHLETRFERLNQKLRKLKLENSNGGIKRLTEGEKSM